MFNLSLKIFRWLPLVNSVLKFQIKLGTLKPQSISLFWPFSIYTWNLAPENACGAEHFSHCVFLGQASTCGLIFSLFCPTMLLKWSISTSKKEITLPSEIWWSSSRNQEMKIGKKWQHHSDHPKRHAPSYAAHRNSNKLKNPPIFQNHE